MNTPLTVTQALQRERQENLARHALKALAQHSFIADLHLGHQRVIEMDPRPFATIEEHDETLTANCIEAGNPGGTLWLLGDVAHRREILRKFLEAIRPAWGQIMLIRGNHDDRVAWQLRELFDEAHEARYLRITKEYKFYLSHYSHRVWRNSHHGAYHLHGHSHGALPRLNRSADCGANVIGYSPKSAAWFVEQLQGESETNHH